MRRLLSTVLLMLALVGAAAAQGAERAETKRDAGPNVSVQDGTARPTKPSKDAKRSRAAGTNWSTSFRAEDIVPDICKGCSS
jgi:hypothetical protein